MNYLSVENISKSYGERTLFDNISFGVNKDQKIAFIAKNGTGKTTIMNILTGADEPDTGQVVMRKEIKMAFLPQVPDLQDELTIEESIFASENPTLKVIEQYEQALENPENEEAYQKAFDNMDRHAAWARTPSAASEIERRSPPAAGDHSPRTMSPVVATG